MELNQIAKLLADFGLSGVMVVALVAAYKLADKWAGLFLDAQKAQVTAMSQQATAMSSLATAVKDGQSDQREVLMAVRLLADRIERQGKYLELIDEKLGRAA